MTSQVHVVSSSGVPVECVSDGLSHKRKSMDSGTQTAQEACDSGTHVLHDQEGETSPITPEKPAQEPVAGVHISQLDKEGSISSITPTKVPQTPSRGSNGLQSVPEGRSPIIREKVSEDGYHWRKYGQKFVRGNEFIRSYYRCTHPTCLVKKQLECSHDGKIADIVYFGQHDHPKPQLNVPVAVGFVLSVMEEKPEKALSTAAQDKGNLTLPPLESVNNSQISTVTSSEEMKGVPSESSKIRDEVCNDDPISKRQKKANRNADPNPEDKPTGETRVVVQTLSEVDIVNDGYRWRKYGQKMVKGNPNPRSYYRCSYPGCPVKKHVERASHDPKVVITSYEGQHEHDVPPSRTVTPNTVGATTIQNGDSKSGAVSQSPVPERKLKEQVDGKFRSKSKGGNDTGSHVVVSVTPNHESKPNGKQYGQPKVKKECQGAIMVENTSASVSKEQENSQSKTAMKESDSALSVHTDTPNEHVSNAGNVQS